MVKKTYEKIGEGRYGVYGEVKKKKSFLAEIGEVIGMFFMIIFVLAVIGAVVG